MPAALNKSNLDPHNRTFPFIYQPFQFDLKLPKFSIDQMELSTSPPRVTSSIWSIEIMAECDPEYTVKVFQVHSLAFVTKRLKSKGLWKVCTKWLLMSLSRVTQKILKGVLYKTWKCVYKRANLFSGVRGI